MNGVRFYMGTYFNPSNESFTCDKNSKIYIDKTGLLQYLNDVIGTNGKWISVSHARRFGKSHAAGMIHTGEIHHLLNPSIRLLL